MSNNFSFALEMQSRTNCRTLRSWSRHFATWKSSSTPRWSTKSWNRNVEYRYACSTSSKWSLRKSIRPPISQCLLKRVNLETTSQPRKLQCKRKNMTRCNTPSSKLASMPSTSHRKCSTWKPTLGNFQTRRNVRLRRPWTTGKSKKRWRLPASRKCVVFKSTSYSATLGSWRSGIRKAWKTGRSIRRGKRTAKASNLNSTTSRPRSTILSPWISLTTLTTKYSTESPISKKPWRARGSIQESRKMLLNRL